MYYPTPQSAALRELAIGCGMKSSLGCRRLTVEIPLLLGATAFQEEASPDDLSTQAAEAPRPIPGRDCCIRVGIFLNSAELNGQPSSK